MTLRVLSAGAVKGLIHALQARFEQQTGVAIDVRYRAVGVIAELVDQDDPFDVLITSSTHITGYAESGRLKADTAALVGAVQTGLAVPAGSRHPDISTDAAFITALRDAGDIYHPDMARGTAGIHLKRVMEQTGLHASLAPRMHTNANGAATMQALAKGSRDAIGFAQATEILDSPGVDYVGPLPSGFALSTPYSIAASATASDERAAETFIGLLTSDEARALSVTFGFDPPDAIA